MTAGGVPLTQVYLDDGTGTFPYDITTKTRVGRSVKRGRQDELAAVTPGDLSLTLDNNDGRFTLGSTTIASPSPIKVDQKIRIKDTPGGNLIGSADAGSFEGSVGGWAFNTLLGARTAGTSIAQSAVRATDGTQSLLATWSTTATGNFVGVAVTTVVGLTYTFAADVYVPTGSPNVRVSAAFIQNSSFTATKDAWVRLSVTFVATATTTNVGIDQVTSTVGQTCFIDSVALSLGTSALTFASGGLTVTRFTGYVQQWPVAWPDGSDVASLVQITATDPQARAERRTLRSVIEEEILAVSPSAYYTLGEPSTANTAADSSGNQSQSLVSTGSGAEVVFGTATGPTTDGLTAATFAGGKYLSGALPLTTASRILLGCAFSRASAPTTAETVAAINAGGLELVIETSGKLSLYELGALMAQTSASVCDGGTHYGFASYTTGGGSLTLDGVLVGSTVAVQPSTFTSYTLTVGGGGDSHGPASFTGAVSHVAVWGTAGSPDSAVFWSAMSTGFAGESGTTRLARTAGYASLPIGTLDTSLTNVGFTDITGKSAGEALRQVADAEMGLVFLDGSGNLTFHNRNRVVAKTSPDLTLTADVLDPGTTFVVDMQGVLNYYTVTATGTNVAQLARGTTSEATHGRYPGSATYLVSTDQEALDRGNWVVYTHAEPLARVGSLVIDAMVLDAASQASLLACEPNTWIRITSLPSQAPGGTTADFIVQGFADTATKDSWQLAFNAANKAVAAPTGWILDNATYSVLDSTTRLYV